MQPSWSAVVQSTTQCSFWACTFGGYCHSSHDGRQTGGNPCGLLVAFSPTDRNRPVRRFRWGNAGLMAGDLEVKHLDWNSRLRTRRGKPLREYTDENSCLIFGPGNPTTNTYNPLATPDFLDIVITKNLTSPVYLTTSRYSLTLHVAHPSSARRIALISGALTAKFQTHLEDQIPFEPELHDGMAIDT